MTGETPKSFSEPPFTEFSPGTKLEANRGGGHADIKRNSEK